MIRDAFTIRKVDGLLIVGAIDNVAPIQLVRQLSDTTLQVHLKNGANYEHVCKGDITPTLLQMFGYQEFKIYVDIKAWLDECNIHLHSQDSEGLEENVNCFLDSLFTFCPNIKSRLISAECIHASKNENAYSSNYTWAFNIMATSEQIIEITDQIIKTDKKELFPVFLNLIDLDDDESGPLDYIRNPTESLCGRVKSVYYSAVG